MQSNRWRTVRRGGFAAVTAVALASAWGASAAAPRPNILLILADDVGWSDPGCYGGEIRTPNLDALAADGLRFTQFYNGARCCPTRASLLSGLYPHQAGVGGMTGGRTGGRRGYEGRLTERCVTLPEVLKTAGYRCWMVGKWHLGGDPGPIARGFDEFYGMIGGYNSFWQEDPFYTRLPEGRTRRAYPAGGFYSTDVFADYAIDFLAAGRAQPDRPWFLYLAFNAAHFPLHAPESEIAKYEALYAKGWDRVREARHARQKELGAIPADLPLTPRSTIPANAFNAKTGWAGRENPAWDSLPADRRTDLARRMAIYAGMIDRMDQAIGRVVSELRKSGELERTLIMFLSDNGACAEWDPWGFDGHSGPTNMLHRGADLATVGGPDSYISYGSGWANACNTPWRLYKHYGHEGGISTPLIVHWPQGIRAHGEWRSQPGHIVDIMATCVEVAGADYPRERNGHPVLPPEGRSLRPAFDGDAPTGREIAWEHEGNRAIRADRWKLVALKNSPWELYDIEADRTELLDLASSKPDKVAELSARWDAWAARTFVTGGAAEPAPGRGAREVTLKAGGELAGDDAPDIAGRALAIRVDLEAPGSNGVLVAHGGDRHGYALFAKGGDLIFSVRRDRKLEALRAAGVMTGGAKTLEVTLSAKGDARLVVDGREVGARNLGGPVAANPQDGVQAGHDANSAAGDYEAPFPFDGRIGAVKLTVKSAE